MRDELLEGICIGVIIGLAVLAIRMLVAGGSAEQGLALALAGVALCGVQLLLSLRRARRPPPTANPEQPPSTPRRRLSRNNPFAQELTRNWTGLNDQPIEERGVPSAALTEQEPLKEPSDQRP